MTTQADMLAEALRTVIRALDVLRNGGEYPDFEAWEESARAALATHEATRNAPVTVETHIKDFRWRAQQCRTNPDAIDATAAAVWDFAADALEQKA